MTIKYPFYSVTLLSVIACALIGRRRSIHADAAILARKVRPGLNAIGAEHIPQHGPALITVNHFTRPGFPSWWIALSISALVKQDMVWIMGGGWTYPDSAVKQRFLEPLTRWAFHRLGKNYHFIVMPPMPPRDHEITERAHAVRQALKTARQTPAPILGLAPEGRDWIAGALQSPPHGAGRFLHHLARLGMPFTPAGIYETEAGLCVNFGPSYCLEEGDRRFLDRDDQEVSACVMRAIARQLPEQFRGDYA
jgi:hypothetical protein